MVERNTTEVGLDTSKSSIQVAMLLPGGEKAVEWEIANEPRAVRRMAKRLKREAVGELRVCYEGYEAGPCGYALQRQLRELEVNAMVVAPSLIPVKPGERVKTNRRDAVKLAVMLRAAALTEVHPPTLEEESVRDLCRCRDDIREDMMRARHRLTKILLRRGLVYAGRAWTEMHRRWLRSVAFEHEAARAAFEDYLRAIEHLEERLSAVESAIDAASRREPYREPVSWLRCFREIDTVTAMSVVAELHDFGRFQSARELMSYLGLVPSENSTEIAIDGRDHQAGQQACTTSSHRGVVALSAQARRRAEAAQTPRGPAGLGDRTGRSGSGAAPSQVLETGDAREGSQQSGHGRGA